MTLQDFNDFYIELTEKIKKRIESGGIYRDVTVLYLYPRRSAKSIKFKFHGFDNVEGSREVIWKYDIEDLENV